MFVAAEILTFKSCQRRIFSFHLFIFRLCISMNFFLSHFFVFCFLRETFVMNFSKRVLFLFDFSTCVLGTLHFFLFRVIVLVFLSFGIFIAEIVDSSEKFFSEVLSGKLLQVFFLQIKLCIFLIHISICNVRLQLELSHQYGMCLNFVNCIKKFELIGNFIYFLHFGNPECVAI